MLQQLYYSAVVKVEWSFDVCLLILILYMWRLISAASLCLSYLYQLDTVPHRLFLPQRCQYHDGQH